MIKVITPGPLTTIQDGGRTGHMGSGLSPCGAMDEYARRLNNLLLDNPADTAVLECTLLLPTLQFTEDAVFAITGGIVKTSLRLPMEGGTVEVRTGIAYFAPAGSVLQQAMITRGVRCCLGLAGGLLTLPILGSRSADAKSGIGGIRGGMKLTTEDLIPDDLPEGGEGLAGRTLPEGWDEYLPQAGTPTLLHITKGPQFDQLEAEAVRTLADLTYTVSADSDRMGTRFEGTALTYREGFDGNIITDALSRGAIQVPPAGKPILMNADAQTTGGYAKPFWLASADRKTAAQLRPGDKVRFELVETEDAVEHARAEAEDLEEIRAALTGATGAKAPSPAAAAPAQAAPSAAGGPQAFEIRVNGHTYDVTIEKRRQ